MTREYKAEEDPSVIVSQGTIQYRRSFRSKLEDHRNMEVNIIYVAISMGAIWGITLIWRVLNWTLFRPWKLDRLLRQQGLSGNSYKPPFGDLMESGQLKKEASSKPMEFSNDILPRLDPFLYNTIKNHGKDSFLWFGPTPMVTITEPELIREVFSKVNEFPKPRFSLVEMLIPGLATYNGEKWAKHRKLVNPAFHIQKLKLMIPAFYTSCNGMMNKWDDMVSKPGSIELDVWPHLVNMTSEVISRTAFSSSYVEGRRAFELIEEQTEIIFNSVKYSFIPGLKHIPTKANRRFKRIQKEVQDLIKGIIDKRMMDAGEAKKGDLLDTMLKCNFKEMQQDGNKEIQLGMTIDEMVDEFKQLYFAGQDTTSILLAFTMILLGRYTDWQTRAREEILHTFGESAPDFDGLSNLKIVNMILYEVLRLYPPVYTIWRKVASDTKLGKWSLPAGVYINMPMIYSHLDPQQWGDDATEFKPERFSQGISEATKDKFVFFPFGLGPRACMGKNLSLIEAKMTLTMILQRFSFELSPSYAHAPFNVLTIRPQFGAHIILHRL